MSLLQNKIAAVMFVHTIFMLLYLRTSRSVVLIFPLSVWVTYCRTILVHVWVRSMQTEICPSSICEFHEMIDNLWVMTMLFIQVGTGTL